MENPAAVIRVRLPYEQRRWRRVFAIGASLVAIAAGFSAARGFLVSAPRPNGGLVIDPVETTIAECGPREIIYTLTNHSNDEVHIGNAVSSCGCTVADRPKPETLGRGGIATMRVRASPPNFGEKRVTIEVYHDAGPPLVARLNLKGRKIKLPAVLRQPSEIVLRGKPGEQVAYTLELLTREAADPKPWVQAIEGDSAGVAIEAPVLADEAAISPDSVQRTYHVKVVTTLGEPGRRRLALLSVRYSAPSGGPAPRPIAVVADCKRSVQASPDALFAEARRDELPKEFIIRLIAPSIDRPPNVRIEPIALGWLEIDGPVATEGRSAGFTQIRVRVVGTPGASTTASHRATIRLTTDLVDCPSLEIPVFLRLKN